MSPVYKLSDARSILGPNTYYTSMLAGNATFVPFVPGNGYELLETTTLSSNTTSVSFSNLNTNYGSTYQHLQLRMTARTDRNDTDDYLIFRFNGDSGNNYSTHVLRGQGSNVESSAPRTSYANIQLQSVAGNTAPTSAYGAAIVDIIDPFETTKNKVVRMMAGVPGSTYRYIGLSSGLWMNTGPVTSIFLDSFFATNFLAGSRFSLYGIRGI